MITGAQHDGGWWWLLVSLHFRSFVCLLITNSFLLLEHFLQSRFTGVQSTRIASMVLCKNKVRPESVDLPASQTIQKISQSICQVQTNHSSPRAGPPAAAKNFIQAPSLFRWGRIRCQRQTLIRHLWTLAEAAWPVRSSNTPFDPKKIQKILTLLYYNIS